MIPKHPLLIELETRLRQEILFLDGAMGTMIQRYGLTEEDYRKERYKNSKVDLKGNAETLNFTRPEVIKEIHRAYLDAGVHIIETNTFNANRISQKDFELENECFLFNQQAARLAKETTEEYMRAHPGRKVYVAGSIGPTNRTASLSPDVNNPGYRAVTYDELVAAYREQVEGLLAGGCELFLAETAFDTLNLKACLFAIRQVEEEKGCKYPVMVSVTITDASGRTLSGQTVEAFWNSIRHFEPLSVGLNCALGAREMRPYLVELSKVADVFISCYPNAGLPNPLSPTGYNETPEMTGAYLRQFADEKLVNIAGGCCGTTPDHIRKIIENMQGGEARIVPAVAPRLRLSGLEALNLASEGERPFVMVGERTNVTGSPVFAKAVREGRLNDAIEIARQQVNNGANILDINFDEGMLDGAALMREFLNLLAAEPDICRIPFMLDSSKWEILEEGLKCVQGKPVVNSISLKDGEEAFLKKARLLRQYGAAAIVMAFDEQGQAASRHDKVRICERAYRLLTDNAGFPAEDIIFDPNVLTVATGMEEHNSYALDFIEATREIKARCPGALVSGGISNLSFSFRGQNQVREAMHSVFLYHAIRNGLDMGIVNAGMLEVVEEIDPELRKRVEDVILNRSTDSAEQLIKFAQTLKEKQGGSRPVKTDEWRKGSLQERLTHSLVHGVDQYVDVDIQEAITQLREPLKIIEGPLMNGMKVVGELFGAGKMFLPQVVKSARVMKKAVAILEPLMEEQKAKAVLGGGGSKHQGVIVMATVKGDVHDIGKNIVSVVLACNGYRVIDLGVMVNCAAVIQAAKENQADLIGLSGLITPSLDEMVFNLQEFTRGGLNIPVLIGGATTSKVHTAVKLDPFYPLPVVHVPDASQVVEHCQRLLSASRTAAYAEYKEDSRNIREAFEQRRRNEAPLLSLEEARRMKFSSDWAKLEIARPSKAGILEFYPRLEELIEFIDWSPFFWTWGLKGVYPQILQNEKYGAEATKLFADATEMLKRAEQEQWIKPRSLVGLFAAQSRDEQVDCYAWSPEQPEKRGHRLATFSFLRQRHSQVLNGKTAYCLADFIAPESSGRLDFMGSFAVTSGPEVEDRARAFEVSGDDYSSLLLKALADRLAEANAEWTHKKVREIFNYGLQEKLSASDLIQEKYRGIRPAPGYPACPIHEDKLKIWSLLQVEERIGVRLTENLAMTPASSVSGFYFQHPEARYFHVGPQD